MPAREDNVKANGGRRPADFSATAHCLLPTGRIFPRSPLPAPPLTVLGIETATDVCAVAILQDDAVLASASVFVPRSHATRLAPLVEQLLAHARLEARDLDRIAVSAGPGSYTGLRIGTSTARGLALAVGAHVVAVGTLDALAAEAGGLVRDGEALAVALPSRRGEVYVSVHDGTRLGEAQAVALDDLPAFVPADRPLAIAGPAAQAVAEALSGRDVRVLDVRVSAERVARLGQDADAGDFEPAYLGAGFVAPPRR